MRELWGKRGSEMSLFTVLLAILWWTAGCENTVTETQVVNEAQGSLSASVAEQNGCFEACLDGGEEAQDCRRPAMNLLRQVRTPAMKVASSAGRARKTAGCGAQKLSDPTQEKRQ